jgi:ribonuclease BN (tRNA processing enzyme)
LEIKFIGTGSGKTSLKRCHSSFLISSETYNLLVDTGDGISRALINQKVSFNEINGILLSHLHPDHYSGLPSLIVQMKMDERKDTLDVICHESYTDFLKELLYQSYLFEENLGFKLNFKPFELKKAFDVSKELSMEARKNSHLERNRKFDLSGRLGFSCSSFFIKAGGKNIFFTGDIGEYKDLLLFEEKKADIMISEVTHVAVEELYEAFRRLEPGKLFLTHLGEEEEEKVSKLSYNLPVKERRKVVAAFDGLSVKI